MRKPKRRARRAVVDTSVLIAGISAFKAAYQRGRNDSADFLYEWVTRGNFVWLVTPEILEEYTEVANRKGIRPHVIGRLLNLLQEEAEQVRVQARIEISP